MDTEKAWEEFQANDSSIRKSESVQQDIQQILDTVTQIKTDVDQLKAEGPKATGPVDEEPSLSAPEEPAPEAEPQAPAGDLMAQPEDGAATPTPEPAPTEASVSEEDVPPLFAEGENPFAADAGGDKESDEDRLLRMAMELDDPELKQQVIALAYQAIEAQKAPPMPPAPPMAEPAPEEILAAAMDANGDGMLSEEEIEPMMRSADTTETVKCDANPADAINDKPSESVAMSDEDKKDDEKKDDDDKSERPKKEEPGVNDELPDKEEDKDSLEEHPEVTEVKIETEEQSPEETEEEKGEAIESIIDSILEEAKERIKDQVIEATEGIDAEHGPFMMSTAEMMKSFRGGKRTAIKTEPVKKSIDWPEDVKSLGMEDKCRFFAKSFPQMDEKTQDNVVTLMDTALGSDATSSIFRSEGVDLDAYYEPVTKAFNLDNQPATSQAANTTDNQTASDATEGVATTSKQASCDDTEAVQECSETAQKSETETVEECNDIKKSADVPEGVGMHIPTVSEMMAFKKSGTSFYTPISREAAEPHGMVAMGKENEIPSVKEMFARRFGN